MLKYMHLFELVEAMRSGKEKYARCIQMDSRIVITDDNENGALLFSCARERFLAEAFDALGIDYPGASRDFRKRTAGAAAALVPPARRQTFEDVGDYPEIHWEDPAGDHD